MMNEIDVFLEHHGVKGQKWGFRNNKNRSPLSKKKKAALIGSAAGIAAGAAAVGLILSKKSGVPISSSTIKKTISVGEDAHKKIMKEIAKESLRLVNEANDHLRANDEALQIPHPQRVALKTDYWKKLLGA